MDIPPIRDEALRYEPDLLGQIQERAVEAFIEIQVEKLAEKTSLGFARWCYGFWRKES